MAEHYARVTWQRADNETYTDNKYSRGHTWEFDGGASVPASASPHIVPLPYSVEANVDPEEAFVAALSSCHMLFFLGIAAQKGYVVDSYTDDAAGIMGKNALGKMAVTKVTLRPSVLFSGKNTPSLEVQEELHHLAHEKCFIANSVNTEVAIDIVTV